MFSTINSHRNAYLLGLGTCSSKENDSLFVALREEIKTELPPLEDKKLLWSFIRGYFDTNGCINMPLNKCMIFAHCPEFAKAIGDFSEIPYELHGSTIKYSNTNMIEFLGYMYADKETCLYDTKYYSVFLDLINPCANSNPIKCLVFKSDEDAIIPSKAKFSDVGYDLTIIKKVKDLTSKTALYDTGIKISVKTGFYGEVVPRSSLSKSGYMLANSVGIIDPSYTGNIMVALTKIDDSAPDLELPFRCCQLIFRKHIYADIEQVEMDFDTTSRGAGGFGSSN